MSKRFFLDDVLTDEGKYRVLQEDSETKERFGVKDFTTREEAQKTADDLQRAVDHAYSEEDTVKDIEVPPFLKDNSKITDSGTGT
jgi:serine protease inhibitor